MFRDESDHVIEKATLHRSRNSKKLPTMLHPPSPCSDEPSPASSSSVSTSTRDAHSRYSSSLSSQNKDPKPRTSLLSSYRGKDPVSFEDTDTDMSVGTDHLADQLPRDFLDSHQPISSFHERGTAYFFARHVAKAEVTYQSYDFIYDVWKPPSDPDPEHPDSVSAAIAAVGLAGLSKVTCCEQTMTMAQHSYGVALQLANAALNDPDEAIKDTTMLSVLLLCTYEFISGNTPQTVNAWQKHVDGAACLAAVRGTKQFETVAGARMFHMLSYHVLISCIRSGLPVPPVFEELRETVKQLHSMDGDPTQRLGPVEVTSGKVVDHFFKTIKVRHLIETGEISGRDQIIKTLSSVDAEFVSLAAQLPEAWRYRQAQLPTPHPAALYRNCHVYSGPTQAITWNGIRCQRLLMQEAIIEQLCKGAVNKYSLPASEQKMLAKAIKTYNMLCDAIIATVPQFFGIVKWGDFGSESPDIIQETTTSSSSSSSSKDDDQLSSEPLVTESEELDVNTPDSSCSIPLPPTLFTADKPFCALWWGDTDRIMTLATSSSSILWPLYIIGLSPTSSPEKRLYAAERLTVIYRETRMEQARGAAEAVRAALEAEGIM